MNNTQYMKWVLEVANQEYKGKLNKFVKQINFLELNRKEK